MQWHLRAQLLVPLGLLLLGVVGISTWTALSSASHARQRLEERVQQVARALTEPPQFPLSAQVLEKMKRLSGAEYLLIGENGTRLTTLSDAQQIMPDEKAIAKEWHQIALDARMTIHNEPYLYSGTRLRPPRQDRILYILYPESAWRDILLEAVRPSLILGGFLGTASILLTLAVGRRVTRRIQNVKERAQHIAKGDFSPMPLPLPKDEIHDLTQAINEMAQQLADYQQAMQRTERLRLLGQVSGGLAHQLRNGITGARLSLQLYMQDFEQSQSPNTVLQDPSALQVALRQLNLLESHLKRFLNLGKPQQPELATLSITELVNNVIPLIEPRCQHAQIEIRYQLPREPFTMQGDAEQLQEMLLNILTNAVEAAGSEGWLQIEVKELSSDRLQIRVLDSGSGPDKKIADKLFEPLVTGKPEGIGLGLAVSQQIAQAHRGTIQWHRENQATCFTIELDRNPEKKEQEISTDYEAHSDH